MAHDTKRVRPSPPAACCDEESRVARNKPGLKWMVVRLGRGEGEAAPQPDQLLCTHRATSNGVGPERVSVV